MIGKVLKTEAGYYDGTTRFNLMGIDSAFLFMLSYMMAQNKDQRPVRHVCFVGAGYVGQSLTRMLDNLISLYPSSCVMLHTDIAT